MRGEEVLSEEAVGEGVAIVVEEVDTEGGGDLSEAREGLGGEVTVVVDEGGGFQGGGFEAEAVGEFVLGVDLGEVGFSEEVEGGEFFSDEGHGAGGAGETAPGEVGAIFFFGFDDVGAAGVVEVAVVEAGGVGGVGVVGGVEAEVGGDEVEVAVVVEVGGVEAVPPSGMGGEARGDGGIDEGAFLVEVEFEGAPFVSDEEVGPGVVIEVAPEGGGDEAGGGEGVLGEFGFSGGGLVF